MLDRHSEIRRICQAALERAPADRSRFVVESCANDHGLCREVMELLARDASAQDFLAAGAFTIEARQLADAEQAQRRALIGRTLSHYRILSQLGAGGMGIVYKAIDMLLDRPVALKLIATSDGSDADSRGRFVREARAASQLNHPNICTIHDLGEHEGLQF